MGPGRLPYRFPDILLPSPMDWAMQTAGLCPSESISVRRDENTSWGRWGEFLSSGAGFPVRGTSGLRLMSSVPLW